MNLIELAKTPEKFDAKLAELYGKRSAFQHVMDTAAERAHHEAGDTKVKRHGRYVWQMSNHDALIGAGDARDMWLAAQGQFCALDAEIIMMEDVYGVHGRWSRFFPSVTNSGGHIHASLNCHTTYITTDMRWAPELSGRTEAEAVAAFGPALCTVCFPSAPVEHTSGELMTPERKAAQDQRAAEKAARDARKDTKRLAPGEVFKTTGPYSERVETVAKCKELVRAPFDTAAELEWYESGRAQARHAETGHAGDAEFYANITRNVRERLAADRADAERAAAVLIAREAANPGHGATAEEIGRIRANAEKKARKDWA